MAIISKIWKPNQKTRHHLVQEGYFEELIEFIVPEFIYAVTEKKVIPYDINRYFDRYARRKLPKPTKPCQLSQWKPGKQLEYFIFSRGFSRQLCNEHVSAYKEWKESPESLTHIVDHDTAFKDFLMSMMENKSL